MSGLRHYRVYETPQSFLVTGSPGPGPYLFLMNQSLPDRWVGGGLLEKTMCWPQVSIRCGAPGPNTPSEAFWGSVQAWWVGIWCPTGAKPTMVDLLSGNEVIHGGFTSSVYPSFSTPGAYQVVLNSDPGGLVSHARRRQPDVTKQAAVWTGLYLQAPELNFALYSNLQLSFSSWDYTLWSKEF